LSCRLSESSNRPFSRKTAVRPMLSSQPTLRIVAKFKVGATKISGSLVTPSF
jgi:hypothetical protein